jgi:hypothetical protein
MLSVSAIDRQGQMALNIGKAFINARRVNSAKLGCEAHFMSFATIVASRNGTEAGAKLEGGGGGVGGGHPQNTNHLIGGANHLDWRGESSGLAGQSNILNDRM